MDHRFCAILFTVCLALAGSGCASQPQGTNRKEILMPLQTGSSLHRRVIVADESARPAKGKKTGKKEPKKQESKRKSPKPTPPPEKPPQPEEEPLPVPDRFR